MHAEFAHLGLSEQHSRRPKHSTFGLGHALVWPFPAMAAAPLTPAEKAAGLDSDLQFIMAGLNVDLDHQAIAHDRQLKSVRMFATVADTRADARVRVRLLWGIDPNEANIAQAEAITRMAADQTCGVLGILSQPHRRT